MYANQARVLGGLLGDINNALLKPVKPDYAEQRRRAIQKMQMTSYHFYCSDCREITSHKLCDDELYMCEECGHNVRPQIEE